MHDDCFIWTHLAQGLRAWAAATGYRGLGQRDVHSWQGIIQVVKCAQARHGLHDIREEVIAQEPLLLPHYTSCECCTATMLH